MAGQDCLQDNTIASFISGQLGGDDLRLVIDHLDRCEHCHALVAGARSRSATSATERPSRAELPSPGDVIGDKYRIERVLGQGGMGVVLSARHVELGQRVAIKTLREALRDGGSETSTRFLQEARALALLQSDNLVRVHDAGRLPGGTPYMVMEYLEGMDLAAVLRERDRLPAAEVIDYLSQACAGLAVAHRAGVVHRDLKPGNLFLTNRSDGTRLVKVLDFGLAKLLTGGSKLTADHMLLGTPRYMAPEQLVSPRDVDGRADVWGLGAIAFRMLVGRPPLDAPDLDSLLRLLTSGARPPLAELERVAPVELAKVVARCLEPEREKRIASMDDLGRELLRLRKEDSLASTPPPASSPALASTPPPASSPALASTPPPASSPVLASTPPPASSPALASTPPPASSPAHARTGFPFGKVILAMAVLAALGVVTLAVTGGLGALAAWRMEMVERKAPLPPGVDPHRVDVKDVISQATSLARSIVPSAELVGIDIDEPVRDGRVDLTKGQTLAFLFEAGSASSGTDARPEMLTVEVGAAGLEAMSAPFPHIAKKLPEPRCSLADAWRSAVAAGIHPSSEATFSYGPEVGVANWVIEVPGRPELRREVDGASCAIVAAPP